MKKITLTLITAIYCMTALAQISPTCNELFISEYIEGSAKNKAIEIYNPSILPVDLNIYSIKVFKNNPNNPTVLSLSGVLSPKSTHVCGFDQSEAALIALCDITSSMLDFDGNNAVGLYKNDTLIDIIGEIGITPIGNNGWQVGAGSTKDFTLVRKFDITQGSPYWSLNQMQYDVFAMDDFSMCGDHQCITGGAQPEPDSVSYYDKGQKNWWHKQKDVFAFRCKNGQAYPGNCDFNIVDMIDHKPNSRSKMNEMSFKTGVTTMQMETERNKVRMHPDFETEFPVITQEPTLDQTFNEWRTVDNFVLVTFNDPFISSTDVQLFALKHDLVLEHTPSNQLPQGFSWTYFFSIAPSNCRKRDAITTASEIWEQDFAMVKLAVPNMRSTEMPEESPNSSGSFDNQAPVSACVLPDDWNRWQWWVDNIGTINHVPSGGTTLSTFDADADICECWGEGYTGKGVKVAVIDFHGFEYTHEDMQGVFLPGYSTAPPLGNFTTDLIIDTLYHGMAVSGLIAARANNDTGIAGVAYGSQIIPILIRGFENEIIMGLQKSVQFGADVINMSFGSTFYTQGVEDAITTAYQAGRQDTVDTSIYYNMVMVGGAGNKNNSIQPFYPASYPEVIGVGGSNPEDFRCDTTFDWGWLKDGSNYGPYFDVVAPSSFIRSTAYMGVGNLQSNYDSDLSGTSFGTAIVSGITAILLEKNPYLSASDIKTAINDGANKVNAGTYDYNEVSGDPGRSLEMQYGRVNCIISLNSVPVGINEFAISDLFDNLVVFNNNNGELIIRYDLKDKSQDAFVRLFDMLGRQMTTELLPADQNQVTVPIDKLANGIYVTGFFTKDGNFIKSEKFIKL